MKALIALLIIVTFSQCKSKREMSSSKPSDMISLQENVHLNPSQALIEVSLKSIVMTEGTQVMEVEVIRLKQQSFGFNAYLNTGELISIMVNDEIKLDSNKEYALIVEENGPISKGERKKFRLIKVIE